MGCHKNIRADRFPKQGGHLNQAVDVCFHYDSSRSFPGVVVRDDAEEPGETIIKLEDGRYVRAGECQYSLQSWRVA